MARAESHQRQVGVPNSFWAYRFDEGKEGDADVVEGQLLCEAEFFFSLMFIFQIGGQSGCRHDIRMQL